MRDWRVWALAFWGLGRLVQDKGGFSRVPVPEVAAQCDHPPENLVRLLKPNGILVCPARAREVLGHRVQGFRGFRVLGFRV